MYLFYSFVCFTGNGVIYVIGRPIDWVVEKHESVCMCMNVEF